MSHESPKEEDPSLSQAAQLLINQARKEAYLMGQREYGTEHFLLAAVKSNEFAQLGINYQLLRDLIIISSAKFDRIEEENLHPSLKLNQAFKLAKNKCLEDGENEISEKILLISILGMESCNALNILKLLGIKKNDFISRIVN